MSLREPLTVLDALEQDATRALQAELEAQREEDSLPVIISLGDLRRQDSDQGVALVDNRTGHAAED
eukprot:10689420-Alexandrium_andersonii.AAC.1